MDLPPAHNPLTGATDCAGSPNLSLPLAMEKGRHQFQVDGSSQQVVPLQRNEHDDGGELKEEDGDKEGNSIHLCDSDESSEPFSEISSLFDSTTSSGGSGDSTSSFEEQTGSSDSESDDESGGSDSSTLSSCTTVSYDPAPHGFPLENELTASAVSAMATFMQSQKAQAVMSGLAERGNTLSSINWLASHVPICVLNRLGDEVRIAMNSQKPLEAQSLVASFISKESKMGRLVAGDDDEQSEVVSDLSETDEYYTPYPGDRKRVAQHENLLMEFNRTSSSNISASETDQQHQPQRSFYSFSTVESLSKGNRSYFKDDLPNQELLVQHIGKLRRPHQESFNALRSRQSLPESSTSFVSILGDSQSSFSSKKIELSSQASSIDKMMGNLKRLTLSSNMSIHSEETSDAGESNLKSDSSGRASERLKLAKRALGIGLSKTKGGRGEFNDPFQFDDPGGEIETKRGSLGKGRSSSISLQQFQTSSRRTNELGRRKGENLPYSSRHQSALLFIDISGFTKLATTLDPESLSKAINSYFQLIVNLVVTHGGDVLKFAGDAVFAEWKATSSLISAPQLINTASMFFVDCVNAACICASRIVAQCSDYPIFAHGVGDTGQGAQVATLNVHCGIGAGDLVGVHVGDCEFRREFVMLGDPIDQVAEAVDAATLGEVAVSPQTLVVLAESCELHQSVLSGLAGNPVVIARRAVCRFTPKDNTSKRLGQNDDAALALSSHIEEWPIESLKQYRKLISLYAHPVVANNDKSQARIPLTRSSVQERHREEAELRSVYVMFIAPLISTKLTGNDDKDRKLFNLLNSIMNLTRRELNRFNGHLRQFIVDDKGLVLIATFGLRGSTFPNLVADRALPATIVIHNALQHELGIHNQIGATVGNAYCGVVGGIKRHEYAVLGPSVNLAARLMGSPKNPGILVDDAVRMMADRSYGFNALDPVKAKGYSELVPIFEPLSPLERSWGRVQPNFVGRKKEIIELMGIARMTAMNHSKSSLVFISAESGMGKSTMVVHAIEHIRKLMGAHRRRMIVTTHVSKESDLLVPFGIFRSILVDVLSHFHSAADEKSFVSHGNSGCLESIGWESLSAESASNAMSAATGMTRSADLLGMICHELNAPPCFHELVGHHLMGIDAQVGGTFKKKVKKENAFSSLNSLVSFMARAFKRCTQDASLVIVALDDVHHMDELSWLVVEELFNTGTGMVFICTCRPLTTYKISMSSQFWHALNEVHQTEGRYISIKLECLGLEDIRNMIARTLGIHESQITPSLQHDVLMHSGGMPHFANEILEAMKRRHISDAHSRRAVYDDNAESAFASVSELLLHRIDSFDASIRNVLNLAAVLGSSFDLSEIVAVLQQISGEDQTGDKLFIAKTRADLDFAVQEGILYVQQHDSTDNGTFGESLNNLNQGLEGYPSFSNCKYTFCHSIWQTMILNLMLDSRKRDMHRIIAVTQESSDEKANDYLSRMKLFGHWKASGESSKAANLALSIGKSFEELGLQDQSIKLYEDAIEMWHDQSSEGGGLTPQVLNFINSTELECIIKSYIALGQCLANIHKAAESVAAFQNALGVLQSAKRSDELRDRSIVFPIFSGLFVAIKFGQIEQDKNCSYEQVLVGRFVQETRLHGDPIHIARSLSMQGEMYGRLGLYDQAFSALDEMAQVYDPETMSVGICAAYGSDRCAQLYCACILWHQTLGEHDKVIEICSYIINDLMPKMDSRNVHNSFMIMYPVVWALKDNGLALRARTHFIRFVVAAFDEFYGNGRSVFALPIFDPILMLLDLASNIEQTKENLHHYMDWALNEENLRFGTVMNCAMGNFGRCADSISAEICYLLAARLDDSNDKHTLLRMGLDVAVDMVCLTESKQMIHARREIEAVYQNLFNLACELGIIIV